MTLTRSVSDRSTVSRLGSLLAVGIVVVSVLVPISAHAVTTIPAPDGLTSATAAASCWELTQLTPAAPSGVYWLGTPTLGAPQQFYCDQTTSGGGWVLVGRGREGWSQSDEGSGTPGDVRGAITGQAAFVPKQLSSTVIAGLLNGQPVTSMTDGVRLRRATNTAGTAWQESTFTFSSPRDEWSWMFGNVQRVGSWTIGTETGTGGMTQAFGSGTTENRIETATGTTPGWSPGFGFGSAARGTPDAASYIWASSSTVGYPRPFSQVFLRPKLMSSSIYTAIADTGTAKVEQKGVAESFAIPTVWGVSGIGAGPNTVEGSNEVSAFAESNGIVYVGGNFLTVQKTAAGGSQVAQAYLAAFDVKTGEWISSFRPTFDRQVKALAVLPNGNLAVGGYFSQVNGTAQPALVALNPTTGATVTGFTTKLINTLSGGVPIVRALDVQGNWLYIGGQFTHMTGGTAPGQVYLRAAGRVSVTNGTPDATWNPEFNGTVISLDASAIGDRVYFAGFFSASKTTAAVKGAAIKTSDTSVIPWTINFSSTKANYQQAVKEVGEIVWIGGSEHMLYSYDRASMTEKSSNVGNAGGDFQAISTDGSVIYGGCHCFFSNYHGSHTWPNVGTSWTQATKISSAGAWDNVTGAPLPQFSPIVNQRVGAGAWALFNDSLGNTWFGGDYTKSMKAGFVSQWSGGFVRFAHNDAQAPTVPSALAVSTSASGDTLTWSGSSDNRGSVRYQILRGDRVIATTASLGATVAVAPVGTKYFVRAVDGSGNWSASTPAALVGKTTQPDPNDPLLIGAGSTWSYSYSTTAPAAGWQTAAYDASGWSTGAAPIGWGQANLGTTLTAAAPQPLTSYYRKSFQVIDVTTIASVTLTTRADDGIVVYVNGVEVGRSNIAPGAVTSSTYAISAISAANALATPVTLTVPGSAFVTGANLITAEVHSNYRATPSASFELTANATFGSQPPLTPPVDPPVDPVADPGIVPAGTVIVPAASTWSYYFAGAAPASEWATPGFDASAWSTGAAPLGWGQTILGTSVTTSEALKPLATYYRGSFTIVDPRTIGTLRIETRADDGIVLFLNGIELTRVNVPAGAVTNGTYATVAVSAANALANPVVVDVPGTALTTGANVISAQVLSNYRATPSASFELTAVVK